MSSPSTSSRLSEEASASAGNTIAGRRLANRSSSLRRAKQAALGLRGEGQVVVVRAADGAEHHGADLLAPSPGSRRRQRHAVHVVGGAADQILLDRELEPAPAPSQPITRRTSAITSGPMPSPGRKRMRRCDMGLLARA